MPRNFATSAAGARPATSRSISVPGAGNPGEDEILRARQATLNTDPFTAEHSAAYAAFCSITDRRTALDLHRHHVTWDDVNDYCATDAITSTDFDAMKSLKRAGVTPNRFKRWQETANRYRCTVTVADAIHYGTSGVTPKQVEPFFASPTRWYATDIVCFVNAHVSPEQALEWRTAGINTASSVAWLVNAGCSPTAVSAFVRTTGSTVGFGLEQRFVKEYRAVRQAAGTPELAAVAIGSGLTPTETKRWAQVNEPLDRICLYVQAGISADEWDTDPTIREADQSSLAVLAAFNENAVSVPDLLATA